MCCTDLALKIDFAVVFNLFAVFKNIFHNSFGILAIFKFNDHFRAIKFTVASLTPSVRFAASSILLAQFAQSTSIS